MPVKDLKDIRVKDLKDISEAFGSAVLHPGSSCQVFVTSCSVPQPLVATPAAQGNGDEIKLGNYFFILRQRVLARK